METKHTFGRHTTKSNLKIPPFSLFWVYDLNKAKLVREIKAKGWSVDVDNIDFRKQDATLWFGFDSENPILQISKGEHTIQLIATGDIRIYGKRNARFVYKGGKPDGKLTPYLRKHGNWENNNWFEVNYDGSSYDSFEEPFYVLNDAVHELLKRLEKLEKREHNQEAFDSGQCDLDLLEPEPEFP